MVPERIGPSDGQGWLDRRQVPFIAWPHRHQLLRPQEEDMHPLNTLINSQRHQVRRQPGSPAPRRRSSTEEAAILAHSTGERNALALTTASALLISMFVILLATVLI
jgi:hypothetical protein